MLWAEKGIQEGITKGIAEGITKGKKEIAKKKSYVDYALHAGVKTKKDVMEILSEKPASYKIFMDLHTNEELLKMFDYVAQTKKVLSLHCEDKTLVYYNIKTLSDNI